MRRHDSSNPADGRVVSAVRGVPLSIISPMSTPVSQLFNPRIGRPSDAVPPRTWSLLLSGSIHAATPVTTECSAGHASLNTARLPPHCERQRSAVRWRSGVSSTANRAEPMSMSVTRGPTRLARTPAVTDLSLRGLSSPGNSVACLKKRRHGDVCVRFASIRRSRLEVLQ